jgi:hypothetical protein
MVARYGTPSRHLKRNDHPAIWTERAHQPQDLRYLGHRLAFGFDDFFVEKNARVAGILKAAHAQYLAKAA